MGKPSASLKHYAILGLIVLGSVAVIGGSVYGYFLYQTTAYEKRIFEERTGALERTVEAMTAVVTHEKITNKNLTEDNTNLNEALITEQQRNLALSGQVQDLAGAVGKLKKLSETPEELLQKYSRTYFLSEHYVPSRL